MSYSLTLLKDAMTVYRLVAVDDETDEIQFTLPIVFQHLFNMPDRFKKGWLVFQQTNSILVLDCAAPEHPAGSFKTLDEAFEAIPGMLTVRGKTASLMCVDIRAKELAARLVRGKHQRLGGREISINGERYAWVEGAFVRTRPRLQVKEEPDDDDTWKKTGGYLVDASGADVGDWVPIFDPQLNYAGLGEIVFRHVRGELFFHEVGYVIRWDDDLFINDDSIANVYAGMFGTIDEVAAFDPGLFEVSDSTYSVDCSIMTTETLAGRLTIDPLLNVVRTFRIRINGKKYRLVKGRFVKSR